MISKYSLISWKECGIRRVWAPKIPMTTGALSIFPANENFDSSSCPVFPQRWWEHAADARFFFFEDDPFS